MTSTLLTPATIALTALAALSWSHPAGPDDVDDAVVATTTTVAAGGLDDDVVALPTTTPPDDADDIAVVTAPKCVGLDSDLLDIDLSPSGKLHLVYADDGVWTCDEWMDVTSYASAGPVIDNHHDPVVDKILFKVSELEAAGAAGITVEPVLDPCWAGLQLVRDGDTYLWEHIVGDGCALEVATDFAGAGYVTEIHVVQQTGNIEPPHIFSHEVNETTLLTGLPNGTWYVKVYEGSHPGTTMAVDGGTPMLTSIVHGVADGSVVDIAHPDIGRRVLPTSSSAIWLDVQPDL